MASEVSKSHLSVFEAIKQTDEKGNEFWSARDLGKVLDYAEYRNFKPVIEKAKEAAENSGQPVDNHFVDFHEMVKIGSGAERGFDMHPCPKIYLWPGALKSWIKQKSQSK